MKNITKVLFSVSILFFLIGCGTENKSVSKENDEELESIEKIEALITNTLPYEEGAYKLVNAQTILYGSGENLRVEARIIEDFYDEEGNYFKTRLLYSTKEIGDNEKIVDRPLAILLSNQFPETSQIVKDLTMQEQEEVKEYILEVFQTEF